MKSVVSEVVQRSPHHPWSWVFARARANQWELSAGCVVSNQRPPNDVLTIHILTGLWHFYGDTRWEPTPHTMMQNPMPHNMLPPTHTNTPASIRFRPHPQNCNQTPFRGAPGSILKILCILKVPNKKEKFVFIIQNSFQLSRRDCEVFNKQNSAAAWRREEYHHSATFL